MRAQAVQAKRDKEPEWMKKMQRERLEKAGLDEGLLQLYCPHSCIYGESL